MRWFFKTLKTACKVHEIGNVQQFYIMDLKPGYEKRKEMFFGFFYNILTRIARKINFII